MLIDIEQDDFGALCICALRYCQGRQTYMPSLIQGIVGEHMSKLSDRDISVMLQDCEFQAKMNLYGDETIDKPDWIRWKETIEKHKQERDSK